MLGTCIVLAFIMFIFVVACGYIVEHVKCEWKNAGIIVTIALVGAILLLTILYIAFSS